MTADLLELLALSTLASSAALAFILIARKSMRGWFGARIAYVLWAFVPLTAIMVLFPAPVAHIPFVAADTPVLPVPAAASVNAIVVPAFDPTPLLLALWGIGALVAFVLFVRQQQRFMRMLGRLSDVETDVVRAEATAGCPALIGALNPRVVLPSDFEQRYSKTERDLILAHENTHRRRGDPQVNLLAAAVRCVFWFNPLVHIAASRFRFDQELACDAAVITRFPEARRSYADAMLKTQLADFGLPVGCYWQSSHPLKERIVMLKQPLPGTMRTALGAAVALALITCGTYAAWASQPAKPVVVANAVSADSPMPTSKASYRGMKRITYPESALSAKTQGVVYVKAHIGADGNVANAAVDHVDPASAAVLGDAAVAGIKTWTFNPAQRDGKPAASDEIVPIVFFLDANTVPPVSGGTLEAIRIGVPADHKTASNDSGPTEDISYRNMFAPKYPEEALKARHAAKVVMKVLVDEKGIPQTADFESSDPPEGKDYFTASSAQAILQWRFNPATRAGKPEPGYIFVPITYSLKD